MKRTTIAALIGTSLALVLGLPLPARADAGKCKATILRNSAAFAQARTKALSTCERNVVVGTLPPSTDCQTEPVAAQAISRASSRLRTKIAAYCGGGDRTCGTGDDDPLASIGWAIGSCPNFENGSCTNAIASCDDISTCVLCIGDAAINQAINLGYGSFTPSTPGTLLNGCQKAIGTNLAAFLRAKSKALAKCWVTVNQGLVPGPCPVPGDGKAATAIAKAESRMRAHMCKACGGPDKQCDGNGDFTPGQIGFASQCPSVSVPGGSACGGAIASLQDIVNCSACVAEFKDDCLDRLAVPWSGQGYPPECNPGAFPTATRTATPVTTPTLTATKTATVTATPTFTVPAPTVTATPVPTVTATPNLCGNGTLDPGEDCDLSAGATCASASNTGAGFACVSCQCACPAFVEFTGNAGAVGVLDTGWTGQGHDATIVDKGKITVGRTTCTGSSRPCGVCTLLGPVDNINAATYPSSPGPSKDLNDHRCNNNTSVVCSNNTPCFQQCVGGTNDGAACTNTTACPGGGVCSAAGTCEYSFGSYLPLAAGGVATCVGNQVLGTITGTANIETGSSATSATLKSSVFSGPTLGEPCPRCAGDGNANDGNRGGTCSSGQRAGKACDINGSSPNSEWGSTSLDCPPLAGGVIATLSIDLSNTTGTKSRTLSTASPLCRSGSFATSRCQCDVCNNAAAQSCAVNADCPVSGRCSAGTNAGKACTTAADCGTGGVCSGRPCTVGTQCPSGTCTAGFCSTTAGICGGPTGGKCAGGTNASAPCSANSQCPGSACNVPGTATQPNQCDGGVGDCQPGDNIQCAGGANNGTACSAASECPGGTCVGTSANDHICQTGPFESFCGPVETFRGCVADSDCPFAGDACSDSRFRECFDNGVANDVVTATGVQSTPVNDASTPTLAALFCVGPTTAPAVNGAAGLPGLGRLELPGIAAGLP